MTEILYIIFAILPALLSTLGTAIGQGLIGKQALHAMNSQPAAASSISKLYIIGMAICETAAIMGVVLSILLINDFATITHTAYTAMAAAAIAIALGISGLCAGIASSQPAVATCDSIARQPFFQTKLLNMMLVTQTLIMTPNMFAVLVSIMIRSRMANIQSLTEAQHLLAGGLGIGLGSIGPSIGLSLFAFAACSAIGMNKKAFSKIMTFTFFCEAIIETPVIFSLLISLMILTSPIDHSSLIQGWRAIAAALCIGLSTIAPGINSGKTGAATCRQIALNLEQYQPLSRITMLALVMIDSFAIYGLLISIIMLLF